MRVTRRTFLSSGVCAAGAAIPSYAFAEAAGQQSLTVSLVAANRSRPFDVGEIFQELGLAIDLVSNSDVSKLSPQKSALLWIVGSTYPDPWEISSNQLKVIEGFLQAGKGVFVEFAFPELAPPVPFTGRTSPVSLSRRELPFLTPFRRGPS